MDTESSETGGDILGPKRMNYQFLTLVRDKKYPQALVLGKKILETEPNNPAVKKFCDFILANNKQLQKMVQQEKEDQKYESVDEDEQVQEEGQQQEAQDKQGEESSSEDDDSDDKEEEEQQQEEQQPKQKEQKEKPKVELRTCTLNQIPHICTRDHGEKQK